MMTSSSSSNDEASSQSEVDSSSNSDSEFHGRQILIKKLSFEACQNERRDLKPW